MTQAYIKTLKDKDGNIIYPQTSLNAVTGAHDLSLADLNEDENHRTVTDAEKTSWNAKSTFSGAYSDLTGKPTIPSKLSQLTTDSTHRVVTDTEKSTWNGKGNKATISTYTLLASGWETKRTIVPDFDLNNPITSDLQMFPIANFGLESYYGFLGRVYKINEESGEYDYVCTFDGDNVTVSDFIDIVATVDDICKIWVACDSMYFNPLFDKCKGIYTIMKDGLSTIQIVPFVYGDTVENASPPTYSFESQYPSATNNLEIELDASATDEMVEAWSSAKMVGSATSNTLTAKGDVPTIDITCILKRTVK